MPQAGFEPVQSLSSDNVEWSCAGNENAEQTEGKVQQLISKKLNVSQENFNYVLDKVYRLSTKSSDKNKQKPPAIICKIWTH